MKPGKKRWAHLRFRQRIRNVLLTYYLTPILLILLAAGGFFYFYAKKSLDEEMGKRLTSIALSASYQILPIQVAALELLDPTNLTYVSLKERLEKISKESQIARIYLFNADNQSLIDTDPTVLVGSVYERNRLHLAEIDQARSGKNTTSILFQGADGAYYKTAFVPIVSDGKTIAVIGVDGSADFFSNLHQLSKRLAIFGLACIAVVTLISLLISRKIVTPVRLLVAAAERIGDGHLEDPIQIDSPNELGFLGLVMDEMRKNIVSRDRELQTMLRGIAHEVRNPLGGIELFAGMLQEEVKEPQSIEAVERIQHEVRTLKNLVEEFLDFARKASFQYAKVPLDSFFSDVRIPFMKEMEARSIAFTTSLDGVKEAEFDPDQMRRVFLNLVRNSIQAVPNGGKINIDAKKIEGTVEFSVSDNGIGIPQENIDKLFDPFFTTKEGGTGLGLSFVRKIVQGHGGEVRVESTPGSGTTISILLPA
jgi:signal transduction histidine kinase